MNEFTALTKAVKELENIKKFSLLMPEVRVNFAYAKKNPHKVTDVFAVDGRITVVDRKPKAAGKIKLGASDHLARILIEISQYDKDIRSALNFKYSPTILKAVKSYAQKRNLTIGEIDRKKEPQRIQKEDGQSILWKVKYLYETCGHKIPFIFYENEALGKEALFVLVGKNPNQILAMVKGILAEM